MNITWAELKEKLDKMSPADLLGNISLYNNNMDEFFPVVSLKVQDGDDVLDDGHLYLEF